MTHPRPRKTMRDSSSTWMRDANCRDMDPDTFFPAKGIIPAHGYRIGLECEVSDECLDYSILANARKGVWGGVGERERLRMIAKYNRTGLFPNQAERDHGRRKVEYVVGMKDWEGAMREGEG